MSDYLDMSELLEVFFEETDEQLQHLDEGILALEKNPEDIGIINNIFRAAHTLKGSSATMGFQQIASLTHSMESLLDRLRSGQQSVTSDAINALLKSVDVLRVLVQEVQSGSTGEACIEEALEAAEKAGVATYEITGRRGIIGAVAALGMVDCPEGTLMDVSKEIG
jgi:two-component system chemotaxis sensor kinase CheA